MLPPLKSVSHLSESPSFSYPFLYSAPLFLPHWALEKLLHSHHFLEKLGPHRSPKAEIYALVLLSYFIDPMSSPNRRFNGQNKELGLDSHHKQLRNTPG